MLCQGQHKQEHKYFENDAIPWVWATETSEHEVLPANLSGTESHLQLQGPQNDEMVPKKKQQYPQNPR